MKIAIAGLWHLGCVTAACLANRGQAVLAYDANEALIQDLKRGKAPLFEPGLNDLLSLGQNAGKLQFSACPEDLNQADLLWVCYDTPVDEEDIGDVAFVTDEIKKIIPHLKEKTLVLISSQLPVGTIRRLERHCSAHFPEKQLSFACSPENLRLGKAIAVFSKPDRVIVGLQTSSDKEKIEALLKPFTSNIIWMSIESAEMTKHALNAFLATSVVFINELATLCEQTGADAREVERGLKSEERIGFKAYLRPGNAIAGGTLARDVNFLVHIGTEKGQKTPLFSALLESNLAHRQWSQKRLLEVFPDLSNKVIVTLGLTYKADTDTLRRSTAIELCQWLKDQGAKTVAYDPVVRQLPDALTKIIDLKNSLTEALQEADAVVVATEWPQFLSLSPEQFTRSAGKTHIFDASGFLMKNLGQDERVYYHSVGRVACV